MRWLVILLALLIPSTVDALTPLRGVITVNVCGPYINGQTAGDTLCPTSTGAIEDSSGNWWMFNPPSGSGVNALPNGTLKAVLDPATSYNGLRVYYQIVDGGVPVWLCMCSYENTTQAIAPGQVAVGNFIDTTTGKAFNNLGELVNAAAVGDALRITNPPTGIAAWSLAPGGLNMGVIYKSVTLTCDPGTKILTWAEGNNGQGILIVQAIGVTVNGCDISGSGDTALRVPDNSTNPTLNNGVYHDEGSTCLLTGAHEGIVKVHSVLLYNCNNNVNACGSLGQCHNLYVSTVSNAADTTCEAVDSTTSLNVFNDGWTVKIRPTCPNGQGLITTSLIGCTVAACRQNGVLDYPCGGNHAVTHAILGLGPGIVVSDGGGWYVVKYGEEAQATGVGCPILAGQTNALAFDHDIIFADNPSPAPNADSINLVCQNGNFVNGVCQPPNLTQFGGDAFTCKLTNSVIVGNVIGGAPMVNKGGCNDPLAGCVLVAGKCTDQENNRWYQDRATAAANENWAPTFTDPITGVVHSAPAWPYYPQTI